MKPIKHKDHLFLLPTLADVHNLQVGDLAPASLGADENGLARVVRIRYRGIDIEGKAYVGYCTAHGNDGASVSNSIKEDRLDRSLFTSRHFNSAELDQIERELLAERNHRVFDVDGERYTFAQMMKANAQDQGFCAWLQSAKLNEWFPGVVAVRRVR